MKKLTILAILLIGVLVFAGCSGDGGTSNGEEYDLSLEVTEDNGSAIEGATVEVDGQTVKTDENGVAQTELTDGSYNVEVEADGYNSESKSVTIDGENSNVDIVLNDKSDDGSDDGSNAEDFVLITSDSEEETDVFQDYDSDKNEGNIASDPWESGTEINVDSEYNDKEAWGLVAGDGWGESKSVLGLMGDIYDEDKTADFPVDLTADSVIKFSVATTGDYDSLKLTVVGEDETEEEITLDDFDSTSTEWQKIEVEAEQFSNIDPAEVSQLGIIADGGTVEDSKAYITDFKISNSEVVVEKPVVPESISLDQSDTTKTVGSESKVGDVTVTYTDDSTEELEASELHWGTEDEKIAYVDDDGNLIAEEEGKTKITGDYEGVTESFEVTVEKEEEEEKDPKELAIQTEETVTAGGTLELGGGNVTYDDDTTDELAPEDLTFSSNDTDVATIDGTTLTAEEEGSTTITATYEENGTEVTADMELTVEEESETKTPKSLAIQAEHTMEAGGTFNLGGGDVTYDDDTTEALDPEDLTFSSNDTDVATIDGTTLTAEEEGSTTITATYEENGTEVTADMELTVEKEEEELASPETLASAPTVDESDVTSLLNSSGTYEDIEIDNWNPDWGQSGSLTDTTVDESTVKLLDLEDFQGVAINEDEGIDVSDKDKLHISYWTPDASKISVYPIDLDGNTEQIVTETLTQDEWTSLEIDISEVEDIDLEKIMQLKFTAATSEGGSEDEGAATIYLDNIYFY
ncbi:MAG: carboxypeptidase regulatory-like domain-containing protein [Bacillota bacterium]